MPESVTPSEPLDTTLVLVSPENIAFQFRLAGPALRAVAFLLDLLVMAALALGLLWVLALTGVLNAFQGPFLVALFFLVWGWGAALEVFNNGQTPGKAAVGLRTVSRNGVSINVAQAVLRNLLRAIDVAPPFFPGVLAMAATRRFQRLGDLAAGTVVIRERTGRTAETPVAFLPPPGYEGLVAGLDVGALDDEDFALVRAFLLRVDTMEPAERTRLAHALAEGVRRRIDQPVSVPVTAELWLVCVASAYQSRRGNLLADAALGLAPIAAPTLR